MRLEQFAAKPLPFRRRPVAAVHTGAGEHPLQIVEMGIGRHEERFPAAENLAERGTPVSLVEKQHDLRAQGTVAGQADEGIDGLQRRRRGQAGLVTPREDAIRVVEGELCGRHLRVDRLQHRIPHVQRAVEMAHHRQDDFLLADIGNLQVAVLEWRHAVERAFAQRAGRPEFPAGNERHAEGDPQRTVGHRRTELARLDLPAQEVTLQDQAHAQREGRARVLLGEVHDVAAPPAVRDAERAAQVLVPDVVAFVVHAQDAGLAGHAGPRLLEEIDAVLLEHGRPDQTGGARDAHAHRAVFQRPDFRLLQGTKRSHIHRTFFPVFRKAPFSAAPRRIS